MQSDSFPITGHLEIVLTDENGNVKETHSIPNLVVSAGKNLIAERLLTASPTSTFNVMSHMGLGTDGTATAAGNTALGTQWGGRQALVTPTRTNNVLTYSCVFGPNIPNSTTTAIQEAGIFNALTGGTMLCRTTFGTITKTATDTLTINWNVTVG